MLRWRSCRIALQRSLRAVHFKMGLAQATHLMTGRQAGWRSLAGGTRRATTTWARKPSIWWDSPWRRPGWDGRSLSRGAGLQAAVDRRRCNAHTPLHGPLQTSPGVHLRLTCAAHSGATAGSSRTIHKANLKPVAWTNQETLDTHPQSTKPRTSSRDDPGPSLSFPESTVPRGSSPRQAGGEVFTVPSNPLCDLTDLAGLHSDWAMGRALTTQ